MSQSEGRTVEALLQEAFTPVEPSERFGERFHSALNSISDAAADDLADWEKASIHHPSTWVKPAAAVVVGGLAGVTLYALSRQKGKGRSELPRSLQELSKIGKRVAEEGAGQAEHALEEIRKLRK